MLWFGLFVFLFLIVVYILPIWLVYRVKKLFIKQKLTKISLVLHVLPALFIGGWGLSKLLAPDYFDEATLKNYFGVLLNVLFVYLAVTTYQKYSGQVK